MTNLKCAKCGLVNFPTATACERCGVALSQSGAGEFKQTFGGQSSTTGFTQTAGQYAQTTAASAYYKPSGEVTVAGLAAGLVGGGVAGVVLAFVYAYLLAYIPFIYLNVLCTIGYTFALGFGVATLLRWGKMRNTFVGLLVTLVVAFASFYFSWAVWLSAMLSRGDVDIPSLTLALNPPALWGLILLVNEHGAWSIMRSSTPVSGTLLWIIWGIEATIVLIGAPLMAWSALTADPFCESCKTWCAEEKNLVSIKTAESGELRRRVESKDFQFLKSVGIKEGGAFEWYRLDLHRCPHCGNTNTLSVKLEKINVDSKGKSSVSTKDFMDKLLLTSNDVTQLRQVSSELKSPPPAPAPAAV
jgi:hypothetical protein